jgi:hypothetical protein
LDVGLDTLGQTKDASMLENFVVEREELGDRQLDLFQTQPRSGGK